MEKELQDIIDSYIAEHGQSSLISKLQANNCDQSELTIIANAGVHPYHPLHRRGEIFVASHGNLDFSTKDSITSEIESILVKVTKKLKERRWNKVYLVPFGPAPLSLQIKSLVYKVLNIETIDVLHIGNGEHLDIEIDPRNIAINSG